MYAPFSMGIGDSSLVLLFGYLNRLTNQTIDDTIVTYQYNPVGNVTLYTIAGVETAYQYNDAHSIISTEQGYTTTNYTYFLDGNRKTALEGTANKEYEYDDLGRIKREQLEYVDLSIGAWAEPVIYTYTYDNRGNRLAMSENDSVTSYTYDGNNRLLTEISETENISYGYDNNGNTILKNTGVFTDEGTPSMSISNAEISITHYDYDLLNRLQTVTANDENISYTYGVDNLRKTKTVNGITTGYIWNGQNMVAETDGNIIKTIHRYSLSGIEQSLEIETFRYRDYIKNGHGDVTYITGSDGDTLYHYDAFGNTLWSSQTSDLETSMNEDNPFQYAGEYVDDETDFIYLRNRYYAPSNGRFITEDPIKDGLNWYAYCGGNPSKYIDPSGLYYLEKDENGQVYAVIEAGDTLSDIALAEVGDANAWRKINYTGDTSKIRVGQRINISNIYDDKHPISVALSNSLPFNGKPNSVGKLYNQDGSVKQERVYGPDGNPIKDTDYNHGGDNHEFPHEHEWENGKRGSAKPVEKQKSSNTAETIQEVSKWAMIGTALYWIVSEGSRIVFPPRNLIPVP